MNIMDYSSLGFFQGFSENDLVILSPFFFTARYVAGTKMFEQGDKAEYLYLVSSGEVAIQYKPHDGPLMTITRAQSGDVFGWSAAVGNSHYTSEATCSLDSELLFIHGSDLRYLYERHPKIGEVILKKLSMVIADRQKIHQEYLSATLIGGFRQKKNGGDSSNA